MLSQIITNDLKLFKSSLIIFGRTFLSPKYLTIDSNSQKRFIHLNTCDQAYSVTEVIKKKDKSSLKRYVDYSPILFKWSKDVASGNLSVDFLISSKHFQRVSEAVCDTLRHSNYNILKMLKSLIHMNLDPNIKIIRFLENELLYKIEYNYNSRLLLSTLSLYKNIKKSSPNRILIFETLIRTINEKIEEYTPTQLIDLIKFNDHFDNDMIIKIEDRLIKFLDSEVTIPLNYLCYLLVLLSRKNRRNKVLIRLIVLKLLKYQPEEINTMPFHIINMISALKQLNFHEVNLLEKYSDVLINLKFLENVTNSARKDFTVALFNFNFSYPKLNDYYLETLIDNPQLFNHQDLINLTLTLAKLNYQRDDLLDIITNNIIPKCPFENFKSKYQWFNYVFSLVLLRCATKDQVTSILRTNFYHELEKEIKLKLIEYSKKNENDENRENNENNENNEKFSSNLIFEDTYNVANILRKYCLLYGLLLLQSNTRIIDLNNLQQSRIPFKEFFDSENEFQNFQSYIKTFNNNLIAQSKKLRLFKSKMINSFEAFAPSKNNYMFTDIKTPYGFSIDAEIKVNNEGRVQIFDDPGMLIKGENFETDFKRIALICVGFNETLLDDTSRFIGPKEAEFSLLRSLGYVVLPLHQNFILPKTLLQRVMFLQNLIASHIKNCNDNQ